MSDKLIVKIAADASEFSEKIQELGKEALSHLSSINPVVAGIAGAAVGVGIAALEISEKWEEAQRTIQFSTGATGAQLESLHASFKNVYGGVDESAEEVAGVISKVTVALGMQGAELDETSKQFIALAKITGEQVVPMSQAALKAFNNWKIQGFDEVNDAQELMRKLSQQTGISVTELSSKLASQGSTLREVGLSFEDAASMVALLSKNGADIPNLTRFIADMGKAGIDAKTAFNSLFADIKSAKEPTEAVSLAVAAFGQRAGPQLADMIKQGTLSLENLKAKLAEDHQTIMEIDESTQTLSETFIECWHQIESGFEILGVGKGLSYLLKGAIGLMQELGVAVISIASSIGGVFLKAIGSILEGLGKLADLAGMDEFSKTLKGASDSVNTLGSNLVTVGAAWHGVEEPVLNHTKAVKANTESTDTNNKTTLTSQQLLAKLKEAREADSKAASEQKALQDALNGIDAVHLQNIKSVSDALRSQQIPALKTVEEAVSDLTRAELEQDKLIKLITDDDAKLTKAKKDGGLTSTQLKAIETELANARTKLGSVTQDVSRAQQDLTKAQAKGFDEAQKGLDEISKSVNQYAAEQAEATLTTYAQVDASHALDKALQLPIHSTVSLQDAWHNLRLASVDDLEDIKEKAQQSFNTITQAGVKSGTALMQAEIQWTQADIQLRAQTGEKITAQEQIQFAQQQINLENYQSNVVSGWTTMTLKINDNFKDVFSQVNKSIISGDWSNAKNAIIGDLKNIGEAVLDKFTKPFTDALAGMLTGVIANFLGSHGLGGIMDGIAGLGSKVAGLGGGAASAAEGVAGSVASSASSVGSSVASTAISGVMSVLNPISAIANVVSAVTGVLSLFGVGKGGEMDRLNNIANDTRFLAWCYDTGRVYLNVWDIRNCLMDLGPRVDAVAAAIGQQTINFMSPAIYLDSKLIVPAVMQQIDRDQQLAIGH